MSLDAAGMYIHIPFCTKKCGYCDFYSITQLDLIDEFVKALVKEIRLTARDHTSLTLETVYLGGGTPTLLNNHQLETIWNSLHQHFKVNPQGEFTIEANPGTLDETKLRFLKYLGLNRLSLGAQSFHANHLSFLERIHSVNDILENFKAAREAGFDNINIDLITAFPGLSLDQFRQTLHQVIPLNCEHISCYTLILEPDTTFYERYRRGELNHLNSDQEADFYELTNHVLEDAGYTAYEISNFAQDSSWQCQHNFKYWNHEPYLGMGPSAHSFMQPYRWKNVRNLNQYLEQLQNDQLPVNQKEKLSGDSLEFEYIFLQLRLRKGLNILDYSKRFHKDFKETYSDRLMQFLSSGMLEQDGNYLRLSKQGWLLADEIVSSF
jgi:oxygen-independent coproporphyrinogen-3 oxidase